MAIAVVAGAVLFWHIRLVSHVRVRIIAASVAAVVVLGVGALQVNAWLAARDDVNQLGTMNVLYPGYLRVAPAATPAAFVESARALEKPLTQQRDEP